MFMRDPWLLFVLVGILLFFVVVALWQWLWNATMPDVFSCKRVRFWQAFRLLLIAQIIFGPVFLRITG
jgi:hypothetical protein